MKQVHSEKRPYTDAAGPSEPPPHRVASEQLAQNGYTIVDGIYADKEIEEMLTLLKDADTGKETFRKSADLFAIRQFLKEFSGAAPLLFNARLREIVEDLAGSDYFIVKAIYFDKPPASNWFVSWHQDLTISVNQKAILPDYGPWTVKQTQFAVQPPVAVLQNIITIRIHLDDTDDGNGALLVLPGSHKNGVVRSETLNKNPEEVISCAVKRGGIMLMRPLLFHSSGRTVNELRRRVIHLELANKELPEGIDWAERFPVFA